MEPEHQNTRMLASQDSRTKQCKWAWEVLSIFNQAEPSQLLSRISGDFLRFVPVYYGRRERGLEQPPSSLILCRVVVSLQGWHLNARRR